MVKDTSLRAYLELHPQLGRMQRAVFHVIRNATIRGSDMTSREIARTLGVDSCNVTGRVAELRDEHGVITLSQKRRCRVTGKVAQAWRSY